MFLSEVGRADQAWPQAGIASPGSSVVDGMIQAHKLPVLMTPSTWARLRLPRSRRRFVGLGTTRRLPPPASWLRRPWGSGSPGPSAA
jgi:hypothetical protein